MLSLVSGIEKMNLLLLDDVLIRFLPVLITFLSPQHQVSTQLDQDKAISFVERPASGVPLNDCRQNFLFYICSEVLGVSCSPDDHSLCFVFFFCFGILQRKEGERVEHRFCSGLQVLYAVLCLCSSLCRNGNVFLHLPSLLSLSYQPDMPKMVTHIDHSCTMPCLYCRRNIFGCSFCLVGGFLCKRKMLPFGCEAAVIMDFYSQCGVFPLAAFGIWVNDVHVLSEALVWQCFLLQPPSNNFIKPWGLDYGILVICEVSSPWFHWSIFEWREPFAISLFPIPVI